jgi:hypothetical protein
MRASTGRPGIFALGFWLLSRDAMVIVAFGMAVVGAIIACSVVLSQRTGGAATVPTVTALAVAWSAGVMLAFGGALRAIPRDRDNGVIALARLRGVALTSYVWGRVGGLVAVLAVAVAGATLVSGLAAISVSNPVGPVLLTTGAALAYALAFAFTLGPVAMAALSARSRVTGYLTLVTVLVVPELVSPWTSALLPAGWHEVTSIPAALDAVRVGIAFPRTGAIHLARAVAGLVAIVAASLLVVLARVPDPTAGREA